MARPKILCNRNRPPYQYSVPRYDCPECGKPVASGGYTGVYSTLLAAEQALYLGLTTPCWRCAGDARAGKKSRREDLSAPQCDI